MTNRPWTEAMRRAQTCGDCGYEYDGDGGCPRCAELEEIERLTAEMLKDIRPRILEPIEIEGAVSNGVWNYLRETDRRNKVSALQGAEQGEAVSGV